jgi:hypothetical protein
MRRYVLIAAGGCLALLTILSLWFYPFWLYGEAVGSLLDQPDTPDYFVYVFIALPLLVIAILWGLFLLVVRLTRRSPASPAT